MITAISAFTNINNLNIVSAPSSTQLRPLLLPELLKNIFAHLDIKTLGCISLVSKEWNIESSRDEIWTVIKNEFKVKGPNFKSQIRELEVGLDKIYVQIKKKMFDSAAKKDFFCKFTETLFKDNIRKIETNNFFEDSGFVSSLVTLTLSKVKKISISDRNITNFHISEKVVFIIRNEGFTFQGNNDFKNRNLQLDHPIEINHSNFNFYSNFCTSVTFGSSILLKWDQNNILGKSSSHAWIEKNSLLNPMSENDDFVICNLLR
ncbi:MAG: F-box protein [Parachlamydiaceae bacterium]|nr:F-box protein [Parachlamydiaceae bacterium]